MRELLVACCGEALAIDTEINLAWRALCLSGDVLSWAATMLFVAFGWLLFFRPLDKAFMMARLLAHW